jgi:hypothetical protein
MLAIEVGDLPEPFDEADVVCESLRNRNGKDWRCRQGPISNYQVA